MFLYKSDVSVMHTINPARMARVIHESGAQAAQVILESSYGVVLQVNGQLDFRAAF